MLLMLMAGVMQAWGETETKTEGFQTATTRNLLQPRPKIADCPKTAELRQMMKPEIPKQMINLIHKMAEKPYRHRTIAQAALKKCKIHTL